MSEIRRRSAAPFVLVPFVSAPFVSAVFVSAFMASGCSGPRMSAAGESTPPAPDVAATIGATPELERLFWTRQRESAAQFTQADVDFMTGMIAHHAQALVMSNLAPTNGASRAVATLCSRIINAQKDEILTMQTWLGDRGQPVPEVHIDGLDLMVHGVAEHHHQMPGMLTREQLEELAAARGPVFDRVFLTYMIQHHRGALTMVDALFASDGAAQDDATYKVASDIHADQVTEIARMELLLAALGGAGQ